MTRRQAVVLAAASVVAVAGAAWALGVGPDRVSADEPPVNAGAIRTVPVDTTDAETRALDYDQVVVGLDELVLAIAPSRPERLYVSAFDRGFFRSDDGGRTWTRFRPFGQYGAASIAVDPRDADVVHAGAETMYKSVDGGESWRRSDSGFGSAHVYALTIDDRDPRRVYAFGSGGERPEDPSQGLFVSDDEGRTWRELADAPYTQVLATRGRRVYSGGDGFHVSTDGGESWRPATRGLPVRLAHFPDVRALAVAPSAPRTLYAGAIDQGVYVSRDGAGSWLSTGLSPLFAFSVAVDARDAGLVYASTAGDERSSLPSGMYVSEDGGRSWRAANSGFAGGALFVVAHPTQTRVAYAVATDAAMYRTGDAGRTWERLGELALLAPSG